METDHPGFQSAVVGVNVLDMESVVHDTDAGAEVDWFVRKMELLG